MNPSINQTTIAPPPNAPRLSATYTNGQLVGATYANPQAVAAGEPDSNAYGPATDQNGSPVNFTPNASIQPVVTASAAEENLQNTYSTMKNLQEQLAGQSNAVQNIKMQQAEIQAEQAYRNAQLQVQQQTADAATTTANSQAAAVTAASTPENSGQGAPQPTQPQTGGAPAAPDNSGGANAYANNIGQATNNYVAGVNGIQGQQDQLATQVINSFNSLMQGTFPLSTTQQSLISSLQTQLTQNVQAQQVANSSYVGQVTEAAYRSGGAFTPGAMAAQINNAVQTGVQKIQDLDNSAAVTMGQLEQGFQQQDYQLINDSYETLSKQLDDKSTALTDTYNAVTSTLKDQNDAIATSAQNNFEDSLQSANFNLTQSQDANDNMFKQAQITEQQYKDNADIINQRAQLAISLQTANLAQATWNAQYGSFMNADGTPNTSVTPQNIPGYTQLPNGMSAIDNSSNLYKTPTMAGVPVVSAATYKTVSDAATAASTLNQMQQIYNSRAANTLNSNQISQYQSLYASLPSTIQTLAPSINSMTQGIFENVSNGNTQFSTAYNAANSQITGAIPSANPPIFGKTFATTQDAQTWAQQSGNAAYLLQLHNSGYSDEQILQKLNGN